MLHLKAPTEIGTSCDLVSSQTAGKLPPQGGELARSANGVMHSTALHGGDQITSRAEGQRLRTC